MEQVSKSLFSSKTFWVAFIQAAIAVIVIFQGAYPQVGALLILKSALDVGLRIYTSKPITV